MAVSMPRDFNPAATGVLPLAVRNATKLINYVQDARKVYVGSIRLGATTDTLDAEGKVLAEFSGALPTRDDLCAVLGGFRGEIHNEV